MKPRLIAIYGPLEGRAFELDESSLSIGRKSSNAVVVPDLAVSRRHCEIQLAAGAYRVKDLQSRHGTFVKGLQVQEQRLDDGDLLKVGESAFLFRLGPASGPEGEAALPLIGDGEFLAGSTLEMPSTDALRLHSARLLAELEKDNRAGTQLSLLLSLTEELGSVEDTQELGCLLARELLEALPARRAAVLLVEGDGGDLRALHVCDSQGSLEEAFSISRAVVSKVVRDGQALLCNDVRQTSGLKESESLRQEKVRSLLCVPLLAGRRCLGLIYLDIRKDAARFERDHLLLVNAAASMASPVLKRLRRVQWLEEENRRLRRAQVHGMIGESEAMKKVFEFIARISPTDSTVLLRGENGTGKDLAAQAIHAGSSRADHDLVAVNCAALSETLADSELFGHQKGAFTGADRRRIGKIEAADRGTLFLDEVGELSPAIQTKLLRVLENRELQRLGSNQTIAVDVRLIAATNRNLEKAIEEGDFRQDLFYRLNVITLTLPPLRDRRADILLLASHFAARHCRNLKRPLLEFSPQARRYLLGHDWPGNVRELSNAVERAAVLAASGQILPEDLPENILETSLPQIEAGSYHEALLKFKKHLILEAVSEAQGNVSEAARQMGLHPNYLHRLMRKLGLKPQAS